MAIHLRDGNDVMRRKLEALGEPLLLSVISRVELEGGIYREPDVALRRLRLDTMLASIPVLAFDDLSADAYRRIVEATGYSRRKLLDRMIAAQALVHRAKLVTMNAGDFIDVPGLQLLAW